MRRVFTQRKRAASGSFFALRRRHSPTHLGAAMSRFAEGCGFGCRLCGSLPPPYFHTARRAAAQRKRAASGSFLLCAEGTARPVSALPCPALPRAADSDADRAEACRRRISIRQGGLPRKEKEPRAALFCSAPKAQPVA